MDYANEVRSAMSFFRVSAIFLSFGAGLWGSFLLLVASDFGALLWIFGPGYLVLAGYLWIGIGYPNSIIRRTIWALSALVQGLWLAIAAIDVFNRGGIHNSAQLIPISWWFLTFTISILGALLDNSIKDEAAADQQEKVARIESDEHRDKPKRPTSFKSSGSKTEK
jgi:hypothetical protein